jgi:hypothetical protein
LVSLQLDAEYPSKSSTLPKNSHWVFAMRYDANLPRDWLSPTPKMVAESKVIAMPERPTLMKARFMSVTRQAPAAA